MSQDHGITRASDEHAAEQRPVSAALPLGAAREHNARRRARTPHAGKFVTATIALTGIAAIAVAAAVLIGVHGRHSPGGATAWSSWSPPDGGLAGEREIAAEVSPFYRASPSQQLVIVTVQNINDATSNTQIAVRSSSSGSLSAIQGTSAVYNLCGLGANCAIATGTPTAARLLLLRHEALELALYTFKYISGVDNVVAILPPGRTAASSTLTRKPPAPGKTQTTTPITIAVVFSRGDLNQMLARPVRQTLPEQLPPTVAQMATAPEAELVSVITGQALFSESSVQAQDGSSMIVLNQMPPQ